MYKTIKDPYTKIAYPINSVKGINILKNLIKFSFSGKSFLKGGAQQEEEDSSDLKNWIKSFSEEHQRDYYYHKVTKETKWEKPEGWQDEEDDDSSDSSDSSSSEESSDDEEEVQVKPINAWNCNCGPTGTNCVCKSNYKVPKECVDYAKKITKCKAECTILKKKLSRARNTIKVWEAQYDDIMENRNQWEAYAHKEEEALKSEKEKEQELEQRAFSAEHDAIRQKRKLARTNRALDSERKASSDLKIQLDASREEAQKEHAAAEAAQAKATEEHAAAEAAQAKATEEHAAAEAAKEEARIAHEKEETAETKAALAEAEAAEERAAAEAAKADSAQEHAAAEKAKTEAAEEHAAAEKAKKESTEYARQMVQQTDKLDKEHKARLVAEKERDIWEGAAMDEARQLGEERAKEQQLERRASQAEQERDIWEGAAMDEARQLGEERAKEQQLERRVQHDEDVIRADEQVYADYKKDHGDYSANMRVDGSSYY